MMTGLERYTNKRRVMHFEEKEQLVPWMKMYAWIEPHYPKPDNGLRPKELEQVLRFIFCSIGSIWADRGRKGPV